ncbi:MAG: MBOAT family protein [Planctomycetota bacterium]
MSFNSLQYFLFLGAVVGLYAHLGRRAQNVLLLLASYAFYGAWDWRFLGLIGLSTGVDYWAGLRIGAAEDPRARRRWLLLSLSVNLGLLFAFKYFGWFADSLVALATLAGFELQPSSALVRFALPVGISFYTFQTLSYTLDIYRGELEARRSLLDFAVFVAFFPQLVAGPIERAAHLLPQFERERRVRVEDVQAGAWLILLGLFKKVVIADGMARLATIVFDHPSNVQGWDVPIGVWAFAWQIYGDFSGYTDMARGSARLMGFDLMRNFRMPYFASNPREFWSRWHISLSTWLRDYLYVPLGGNRGGTWATYRNLSLTMLLGGLWHGAAWHFVAWGAYQGALLVIHRALAGKGGEPRWSLRRGLQVAAFFQAVCLGWVLFRVPSLGRIPELGGRLLEGGYDPAFLSAAACLFALLLPLLALHVAIERSGDELVILKQRPWLRSVTYATLLAGIAVFGVRSGPQFIYFQF